MKHLKIKIVILCIMAMAFLGSARAQMTEGQAAVVGGIIGYVIGKQNQPQPVYAPPPQPSYAPSYPPVYAPQPHPNAGYCGGYKNEQWAYCMGNIQRQKNEEAYRRGLYGY